jgi:phosphatidylserine/phosphatidylglycerophosphate/cardiolipin synthase-like enzyme
MAASELTVKAYRGDGAALLAFDVDPSLTDDLAGFAIVCQPPKGDPYPLLNRLTFDDPIVAETSPTQKRAIQTDTAKAPLQKFHWSHFPRTVQPGAYRFDVTAMLFAKGTEDQVEPGPKQSVEVELVSAAYPKFQLAFTRGYVSSQAYVERFHDKPLIPTPQTVDYDTSPFDDQYEWLGSRARDLIFGFIDEAIADSSLSLDVFAFDLDEPDIIRRFEQLGPRLRLFLDNSKSHVDLDAEGVQPIELDAKALLTKSAGADNVKVGHFSGLAHSKVLIQRRGGTAVKALSGSANFSVRGLYVQSNNVFVFEDADTAGLYLTAFQQAWDHPPGEFDNSQIAEDWCALADDDAPPGAVAFSPHTEPPFSLDRVAEAIKDAKSSVLFAIMDIGTAKGAVTQELLRLPRPGLYAYGTTQKLDGTIKTTTPTDPDSPFIPFSYLKSQVPPPFDKEAGGGSGIVIHHKFVVCDFNDASPVVFAGSSNLAAGGETRNGDNLVMFSDREVATAYAVQAIQLIDHYRFRAVQSRATSAAPLRLKHRSERWAADYFDPDSPKCVERTLFVK